MIVLPTTPATVSQAIVEANTIAYGFDKHTDDGYWNALYLNDPDYAWKRMLGWLLPPESPDVAKFGLYAIPPSPWNGTVEPPVVVPPVVPPVDPPPVTDALGVRLDRMETDAEARHQMLMLALQAILGKELVGEATIKYLGVAPITLRPK